MNLTIGSWSAARHHEVYVADPVSIDLVASLACTTTAAAPPSIRRVGCTDVYQRARIDATYRVRTPAPGMPDAVGPSTCARGRVRGDGARGRRVCDSLERYVQDVPGHPPGHRRIEVAVWVATALSLPYWTKPRRCSPSPLTSRIPSPAPPPSSREAPGACSYSSAELAAHGVYAFHLLDLSIPETFRPVLNATGTMVTAMATHMARSTIDVPVLQRLFRPALVLTPYVNRAEDGPGSLDLGLASGPPLVACLAHGHSHSFRSRRSVSHALRGSSDRNHRRPHVLSIV